DNRNPKIVDKLNEMGVAVTMDEWQDEAGGAVLGRPHLAAILVRKGYVSSIKQAFDKYIGQGAPAYFDKDDPKHTPTAPARRRPARAAAPAGCRCFRTRRSSARPMTPSSSASSRTLWIWGSR